MGGYSASQEGLEEGACGRSGRARGGGDPLNPPRCTSTTMPVGACAKSSKPSPYARRYSDGSTISASCDVCPAGTYLEDDATSAALHDSVEDCDVCPAGT
jgi:hypothetical protein